MSKTNGVDLSSIMRDLNSNKTRGILQIEPHRIRHDSQNVVDELTFRRFELVTNNIGTANLAEII